MDQSTDIAKYLKNYKLQSTVGTGTFAKVKSAEHLLTKCNVAIKILNRNQIKDNDMDDRVRREIQILRLFEHPHVVRLYEVVETPSDICFVMEYAEYGDLFDYIENKGAVNEDQVRKFFQQIIAGVEYCHRNMVAHRDLKLENLLLDSRLNIKIIDFGLSNVMRDGHFLKTSCGSQNYAAPEVLSSRFYDGAAVDIWSCGVILYILLCGTFPFDDANDFILFKKIKAGIYTLPCHLSPIARDLISRLLVVDPTKRFTIPEIRMHPWFQAHLPHHLAVPPPDAMQLAKEIDEVILQEVTKMGFDRNTLVHSLRNKVQTEGTVAYYLLLDNMSDISTSYRPGSEFHEFMDCANTCMVNPIEYGTSPLDAHLYGAISFQRLGASQSALVGGKWAIGLQSQAHPREIMLEVLKALKELNVCSKKIGQYRLKCKWVRSNCQATINENVSNNRPQNAVKFEMQLYTTNEHTYVLDLLRVDGAQFLFLELCAVFLAELRVI